MPVECQGRQSVDHALLDARTAIERWLVHQYLFHTEHVAVPGLCSNQDSHMLRTASLKQG